MVGQEDQGDHNPPWWTRSGFYILRMAPSFWLPTKPTLQTSPERRLLGRSICRSVTLVNISDGRALNAHGY